LLDREVGINWRFFT